MYGLLTNSGESWALTPWPPSIGERVTTTPIEQAIRVMVFNRLCDADSKLGTLLKRYAHIRRLVIVADRGLLSLDNVAALSELKLPSGQPMEFILAVPGRRYGEFAEVLQTMQAKMASASSEVIDETRWGEHRLVIAHDPITAREQSAQRQGKIDALHARAAELAGKLDAQGDGAWCAGAASSATVAQRRASSTKSVTLTSVASSRSIYSPTCSPMRSMRRLCSAPRSWMAS